MASLEKVGRYEIKGELGRGGMATVYRGYDPMFEREVAVKLMPREFLHDPQFRIRFEREAKTIALLEHPAILPVYDVGEHEGQPFFVMKLMSGKSLGDKLKDGPLSIEEASAIMKRIASGLDEAHAKGIVHRDLKPGNILFDTRGEAYVADFGIAKVMQGTQGNMTGSGIIGTPSYMSPEQARGEKDIDGRSDVYALGTILFEMLSGSLPFEADTPIGVAMKHITEPVPHILEKNPDLPESVQGVIAQAMAKDRHERYAMPSQMAAALEAVARGESVPQFDAATAAWKPDGVDRTVARQPKTRLSNVSPTVAAKAGETLAGRGAAATAPTSGGVNPGLVLVLIGVPAILVFIIGAILVGGSMISGGNTAQTATAAFILNQTQAANEKLTAVAQLQSQITATAIATQQAQLSSTQQSLAATGTAQAAAAQGTAQAQRNATATAQIQATTSFAATATAQAGVNNPKVAFVNANDLWVVNVDGSNLKQLTKDGAQKIQLRWLSDGRTITFISGKCVRSADYVTGQVKDLVCFSFAELVEGFEVSPDGRYFGVAVDRILYIGDYDPPRLAQATSRLRIEQMASCLKFENSPVKQIRWGRENKQVALLALAPLAGKQADYVMLFNLNCGQPLNQLKDSFPGTRFTLPGFDQLPQLSSYGWDAESYFALNNNVRNDGYGDLYLYNSSNFRPPTKINPLEVCCYRDTSWNNDGKAMTFAFQDIRDGAQSRARIYYIQFASLGTGAQYKPIPLPETFFATASEKPFPAISPTR
ncbi:MAG: serine/threonine-protein kinase [Chloroflexi bacterium]|nr:serine/threonine-protein kinase [Chloroflexota bacterium]MBI5712202.1 serine/threonine-protein kinase [Chloroflexota bacterium]